MTRGVRPVCLFIVDLASRVQQLDERSARLGAQARQDSRTSSKPLSSDPPRTRAERRAGGAGEARTGRGRDTLIIPPDTLHTSVAGASPPDRRRSESSASGAAVGSPGPVGREAEASPRAQTGLIESSGDRHLGARLRTAPACERTSGGNGSASATGVEAPGCSPPACQVIRGPGWLGW
jgi:Family of unknown function (DUF6444)